MAITVAKLEAILSANTHDFDRAMDKSESRMHKIGKVAGTAGLAIVGGLAVGLEKSVHAAIDAEKTQARLEVAFKRQHLELEKYEKRISAAESASRKLGFTDEQVKQSLGSLVTATGNVNESLKEMHIAQDLARFKGVSLEQATKALTMAHAGSFRALKQLGIETVKVTTAEDKVKAAFDHHTGAAYANALAQAKVSDKAATVAGVMQTVTDRVHGQADAYSKTAAGAMEQFHAQLQHVEVEVGQRVLPVLTRLIQWAIQEAPKIQAVAERVFGWIRVNVFPIVTRLKDIFVDAVGRIRAVLDANGPELQRIFDRLGTAIKAIANVAMPILRFAFVEVLPVVLNIAIKYIDLVSGAIAGILRAARAVRDFIGGIFRDAASAIERSGVYQAVERIVGAVRWLIDHAHVVIDVAVHAPGGGILNKITGGSVPGIVKTVVPLIPKAAGGAVRAGASYMVGEQGPELFVPNRGGTIVPNGAGGGMVVHVHGSLVHERDLAKYLREVIRRASLDGVTVVPQARPGF